mmetsp:Transcript_42433/g.69682  ORF Transcript_42433/g.69682 Transcript_42433/m.69682 type:complete len:92 (-) Transcript_42433:1279-1554(-)
MLWVCFTCRQVIKQGFGLEGQRHSQPTTNELVLIICIIMYQLINWWVRHYPLASPWEGGGSKGGDPPTPTHPPVAWAGAPIDDLVLSAGHT